MGIPISEVSSLAVASPSDLRSQWISATTATRWNSRSTYVLPVIMVYLASREEMLMSLSIALGTVYSSSRCLMDTLITCTLHITFGSCDPAGKLGYLWKLNLEERGEYRIWSSGYIDKYWKNRIWVPAYSLSYQNNGLLAKDKVYLME